MKIRTSCDVCKKPRRRTQRYRVGLDGDLVAVDLCREDGEYLDKLIKLGERIPNARPVPKVWTIDEIEKERKKGKSKNRP